MSRSFMGAIRSLRRQANIDTGDRRLIIAHLNFQSRLDRLASDG
jgi:hypothetical protein